MDKYYHERVTLKHQIPAMIAVLDQDEIEKQFYLRGASFHLNIIKNGQHNEASWEKENKVYFDYLWK
jgi:hypothetical protein